MPETPDTLVPDRVILKEFNITSQSLFRWDNKPSIGFPKAIKINGRNYRSRREIEQFKQNAMSQRDINTPASDEAPQ